jgi:DNA-binding winged helix-turn-helix (wHTH) protein
LKPEAENTVRFGEFELDLDRRELRKSGRAAHLSPRAFALLELLVTERPRTLSKDDLRKRLWPDTYVSNTALAQLVTEVRKALADRAREARWIRTVFGFGYGFAGTVEDGAAAAAPSRPACWLRWGHHHLTLDEGENLVGRGSEADVRIGVPEVSRRHARIVVEAGTAVLEDLQSRNGTFVRGRQVNGPTKLADGDEVAFGPEVLVFCSTSASSTTRAVRRRE